MPSLPGLLPSPTFFGHDCEPTWWTSAPGPVGSPSLVPGLYVTDAILGGVTGRPVPAGTTVMATLTLQVAGGSGVYTLGLADGTFIPTALGDLAVPLVKTAPLNVRVGQ